MVKIYILTDDFEKWIEKIKKSVQLGNGCRIMRQEIYLRDTQGFISVEIHKRWSENERGKVADVIILDKKIEREQEWNMRASLLGHRNSIIKTEDYYDRGE